MADFPHNKETRLNSAAITSVVRLRRAVLEMEDEEDLLDEVDRLTARLTERFVRYAEQARQKAKAAHQGRRAAFPPVAE